MHPIDVIAAAIRQHPNHAPTREIAATIAVELDNGAPCDGCTDSVADIIDRVNPDRTMGAGALAEAIWNDLNPED